MAAKTANTTIVQRGNKRIACKICGQDGLEWVKTSTNNWFYAPYGTEDLSGAIHATRPEDCRTAAAPTPSPTTASPSGVDLSGIEAQIKLLQDNDEALREGLNDLAQHGGTVDLTGVDDAIKNASSKAETAARVAKDADDRITALADDVSILKANAPVRIEIVTPNLPTVTMADPHPMFLNGVVMLKAIGQDGVLTLHGEAGSRKTSAVPMFAEALSMEWETFPISIDTVKSDLLGYRNGLNGEYVEGPLFRGYTKPILMGFDEFDKVLSGIATVMNGAFANQQYGFPHGMYQRNPDSLYMAMMNTMGRGPDALYNSGQQLDGATLDRLVYLPWASDRANIAASVGLNYAKAQTWDFPPPGAPRSNNEYSDWADYVWEILDIINAEGIRCHIGGRAVRIGAKLLAAGIDRSLVEWSVIWGHMSQQDAETVKAHL